MTDSAFDKCFLCIKPSSDSNKCSVDNKCVLFVFPVIVNTVEATTVLLVDYSVNIVE